jgi:hypothetical protein
MELASFAHLLNKLVEGEVAKWVHHALVGAVSTKAPTLHASNNSFHGPKNKRPGLLSSFDSLFRQFRRMTTSASHVAPDAQLR